ncbi:anti-sigma factor [Candidatus Microgenomates bacterium]|nr:anti-sigma factor [Candidatus Microgenomates bacterium]
MATNRFDIKNINRRDALVGFLILIVLAVVIYMFAKPNLPKQTVNIPSPKPEEVVEQRFKLQIPDDIEKAELTDVSGGTGSGIATRSEILVDLPDPEQGKFYQAWLEKDGNLVSLGKMGMEKGGWLISYSGSRYPSYNKVVVSLETRFDSSLETKVLEGNF